MPTCPAGHRGAAPDWCDVCGRPLDAVPVCPVCGTGACDRFCEECGADTAVPAAGLTIGSDAEWFAHVLRRSGDRVGDRQPPDGPPRRVRLDHRRVVLGRLRPGHRAPDVDLTGDDGVSGRHAVLLADDGGWCVVDLGSRNGTAVGSCTPITPYRRVPVPPGVPVRLGLWTSVLVGPRT